MCNVFGMTEEIITEEIITEYERDKATLFSNKAELIKLVEELTDKKDEITQILRKIEEIKQSHQPIRPSSIDFEASYRDGWNEYFSEGRRYIQKKNEQKKFEDQLEGLNSERKEIEDRIRPLVPKRFYGIQIVFGATKRLTVCDDSMTI